MPIFRKLLFSVFAVCYFLLQPKIVVSQQASPIKKDTLETHIKNSAASFYKKYPQEKVFVHLDKPVYSNGETLWYKVYAMAYGKASSISKIIYVQLTDTAGNVITQNKLLLIDGKAHGNISLNNKIKTGWYQLTAFTSWMMNFDRQAFFKQRVYIQNLGEPIAGNVKNSPIKKTYCINFYPEGGDAISGAITRYAFACIDENGAPATADGVIKDKTGKMVAQLTVAHDGMGQFEIEAFADNAYTASINFHDGSHQDILLPKVKTEGLSLQVGQFLNSIKLRVAFAGRFEKFSNCLLAAVQNNGQIITYPLQLGKGFTEFELPKSSFSTGILRLTVFSHDGLPRAERIIFVNNHDIKTPELKTDSLSFSPKGLNSFLMALKDNSGQPLKGNFSVSVTDADAFKVDGGQNIFSALLLSPELSGEVNNPSYYFQNQSDTLAQQLDLVMLTNGWRHFTWKSILNNERTLLKYPAEQSQYIAGSVLNYQGELKNKGNLQVKMMILNQDSTKFMGEVSPDNNGDFILRDFNQAGLSDLFLEARGKKNRPEKLDFQLSGTLADSLKGVNGDAFQNFSIAPITNYYVTQAQQEEKFRLQANSILLKTINVKTQTLTATQKLIEEHVSPVHRGDREFTLDLVNNPSMNIGLIQYIRGRFPGLQIYGDGGPLTRFVYRAVNTLGLTSLMGNTGTSATAGAQTAGDNSIPQPYFYLNDAPINALNVYNMDMDLSEIALIRFIPPPVFFAPFNGGNIGAILIYTKIQSDEVRRLSAESSFTHFIFNGYSVTREFAQPLHNKSATAKMEDKDSRTLLYWNHDINTDKNGALKFNFYNSDNAASYKVVVQGMDDNGKLVYFNEIVK